MTYTQKVIIPRDEESTTKLIKTSTTQKVTVLNNSNKDNSNIIVSG
jgi:hypothetical protein